mgnify:CR=1 FL=1
MNFTEIMNELKYASLFEIFRLGIAIHHELENPVRIKAVRLSFKIGDTLSFFDEETNGLRDAEVLEKNNKYVAMFDRKEKRIWKIPYCFLNIDNVDTEISQQPNEKLTKNNLKVGESVGFNHDGIQIVGVIVRLNHKTVTLITPEHKQWRVGYGCLYKIIDGEIAENAVGRALIEA